MIATAPRQGRRHDAECAELGIKHVWMHRSYGQGSVSGTATVYGREHGITVIDGECPLMFDPGRRLRPQGHAGDLPGPGTEDRATAEGPPGTAPQHGALTEEET